MLNSPSCPPSLPLLPSLPPSSLLLLPHPTTSKPSALRLDRFAPLKTGPKDQKAILPRVGQRVAYCLLEVCPAKYRPKGRKFHSATCLPTCCTMFLGGLHRDKSVKPPESDFATRCQHVAKCAANKKEGRERPGVPPSQTSRRCSCCFLSCLTQEDSSCWHPIVVFLFFPVHSVASNLLAFSVPIFRGLSSFFSLLSCIFGLFLLLFFSRFTSILFLFSRGGVPYVFPCFSLFFSFFFAVFLLFFRFFSSFFLDSYVFVILVGFYCKIRKKNRKKLGKN